MLLAVCGELSWLSLVFLKAGIGKLNQFIAKNPSDARAYQVRGILRLLQRNEKEAAKDFNSGA